MAGQIVQEQFRGTMNRKALDAVIEKMIEDRIISEEQADAARVCLACIVVQSGNEAEIKKLADCVLFDTYIERLKRAQYFSKAGKLEQPVDILEFFLMILIAEGSLERRIHRGTPLYRLTTHGNALAKLRVGQMWAKVQSVLN